MPLIVELCKEAGFGMSRIDGLGSVIGRVRNGPKQLAFDAHIDTVEVGTGQLDFDRSAARSRMARSSAAGRPTRKAAASMITAGRILKELGYGGEYFRLLARSPSWRRL